MKRAAFYILLFLFCSHIYAQQETNWDSIQLLNQKSESLIETDLKQARVINDNLLEHVNEDTPTDVALLMWNVRSKIAFYEGKYEKALASNLEFLKYAEIKQDTSKILDALIIIGNINYYTDAYHEAIQYLKQSIDLISNSTLPNYKAASVYNTLGALYNSLNVPDSSLLYYEKALGAIEEDPNSTNEKLRAIIYTNLGALYLNNDNIEKSVKYLELGIEFNKKVQRYQGLALCYNKLGSVYLTKNELNKAFELFKLSDSLASYSAFRELQKDNKYSLIKYYLIKGKSDTALLLLQEFNGLIDSVITDKTQKGIHEMKAKYELDKKETALALSQETTARLNAENKTKDYYLYLAVTGILVLLLVLYISYRYFKHKRKLNELELEIKDSKLDELLSNQESKAYAAILTGQEKERERIAQDLHDRLGGTLAALKLALRKPTNTIDPEDLKIIDEAILDVRGIAHNLSTGVVQKYGLSEALNQLFRALESSDGIKFSLYIHPKVSTLGHAVVIELYRITQELVSNTLKHAEATEVSLQTNFDIGSFNFIFEDNGKGFEESKVYGGIGLENIKARVNKLGGDLHIDTKPGRGTIVIVELKYRS